MYKMVKLDEYIHIKNFAARSHFETLSYMHFLSLADVHTWTRYSQNWIQYSVGYVSTTALLLSQNGLRNDFRGANLKKKEKLLGENVPKPPYAYIVLFAYTCIHNHQTSM